MKATTIEKPTGTLAYLAIQCTCPDTQQTGSFLFTGETHRNPDSRVSPVFDDCVELFQWCNANGWKRAYSGHDAPYRKEGSQNKRYTSRTFKGGRQVGQEITHWFQSDESAKHALQGWMDEQGKAVHFIEIDERDNGELIATIHLS